MDPLKTQPIPEYRKELLRHLVRYADYEDGFQGQISRARWEDVRVPAEQDGQGQTWVSVARARDNRPGDEDPREKEVFYREERADGTVEETRSSFGWGVSEELLTRQPDGRETFCVRRFLGYGQKNWKEKQKHGQEEGHEQVVARLEGDHVDGWMLVTPHPDRRRLWDKTHVQGRQQQVSYDL